MAVERCQLQPPSFTFIKILVASFGRHHSSSGTCHDPSEYATNQRLHKRIRRDKGGRCMYHYTQSIHIVNLPWSAQKKRGLTRLCRKKKKLDPIMGSGRYSHKLWMYRPLPIIMTCEFCIIIIMIMTTTEQQCMYSDTTSSTMHNTVYL